MFHVPSQFRYNTVLLEEDDGILGWVTSICFHNQGSYKFASEIFILDIPDSLQMQLFRRIPDSHCSFGEEKCNKKPAQILMLYLSGKLILSRDTFFLNICWRCYQNNLLERCKIENIKKSPESIKSWSIFVLPFPVKLKSLPEEEQQRVLGEEKMLGMNKKGATSPASKKSSPDASKVSETFFRAESNQKDALQITSVFYFVFHLSSWVNLTFKPVSRFHSKWLLGLFWAFC